MKARPTLALLASVLAPGLALGDEPPTPLHQPSACTVPGRPIALCAKVTDDVQVAKARVYFKRAGEKFYGFVDMQFEGLQYCATLPAPRPDKAQSIEYYVQALDNAYQTNRTSTFLLQVLAPENCEFPPLEKDAGRAAAIVVYATSPKQGRKLSDAFVEAGVRFVPAAGGK
jgi:hypothetical protein